VKVLFIGGTGLISTAVSKLALSQDIDLYLLNRGNRRELETLGAKYIIADIGDPAAVKSAISGIRFDAVVNWIAYTPSDILRDMELFFGTGHYVFISSAAAYSKPVSCSPVTEDFPRGNSFWEYGQLKYESELILQEAYKTHGFPFTVVRPSHTYGDGKLIFPLTASKTQWTYLQRMFDGKPTVLPNGGDSLWTVTHNSDFAKALVGLLGNPDAIGEAFQITSDEALSWREIVAIQAEIIGVESKTVGIPSEYIAGALPEFYGPLLGDKNEDMVFDNSKIKNIVPDFICTTPFRVGIRRSIEYLRSNPALQTIDVAYNKKMDTLISEYFRKLG